MARSCLCIAILDSFLHSRGTYTKKAQMEDTVEKRVTIPTLMAYVCDDCPSQPSQQALLSRSPLCAELAKCFVPLKRFEMTVKLLRKLITSTRTTLASGLLFLKALSVLFIFKHCPTNGFSLLCLSLTLLCININVLLKY